MKTKSIIAFLLLLSGCGLSKPYPEKSLYALRMGDPASAATQSTGQSAGQPAISQAVLCVDRVQVADPYDATTFIYRLGDSNFTSDYYNGFIAPPGRLLTGELSSFLTKSELFKTVLSGESSADYQLALETNVTAMYGDYRPGEKPQAVITARFFLIDEAKGHYAVVFDKTYSQNTPIEQKGSDALVKAWETGWTNLLTQLVADLRTAPMAANARASGVGQNGHVNSTGIQ